MKRAHLLAIQVKIERNPASEDLFQLKWEVDILQSDLEPVDVEENLLRLYAGHYGRRIVSFHDGNLYYQGRAGIDKALMMPIDAITFRFKEVDFFRVQFVLDDAGQPVALKGLYDDQFEDMTEKTQSRE